MPGRPPPTARPAPRRASHPRRGAATWRLVLVVAAVTGAALPGVASPAAAVPGPIDPVHPPAPAEEHGVPIDIFYNSFDLPPSVIQAEVAWRRDAGVNTIYVPVSELDLADDRKLVATIDAGHQYGMQVILDPYIGGTFSGDEGGSAAPYLAAHPGDVAVSRHGEVATTPALDQPTYQAYLRDTLTSFLAYDVDGVVLDEPQYPIAEAPGDYFPYDDAARSAFQSRFGHAMPATDDAEVTQFRRERMALFLGGLLDHIKAVRPDVSTRLAVLPDDGMTQRGTEDWKALAALPSLDALQTDPYWGPDESGWPYYVHNIDKLVAARAPGKRLGVWINAHSLTTSYDFLGRSLLYARDAGVEQLLAWETHHLPNDDPEAAWTSLRRAFNLPFGWLDAVERVPGGVRARGWATDPKTAAPIAVHLYVDGRGWAVTTAAGSRPDVAAAYPVFGPAHGYDVTAALPAGDHTVCAYGINTGPVDGNVLLGCEPVTVESLPIGYLDSVTPTAGGLEVRGWTIDEDVAGAIDVHVYVDGIGRAVLTTADPRPDVAAAYPAWGSGHGFRVTVPVGAGTHQVCAYGINQGAGSANRLLGCLTG